MTGGWDQSLATSLESSLAGGQLLFAVSASVLGGFLTALTPCVYPLIPITVRYFGVRQESSRGQVALRASAYILGMMVLYTVLGTLFASLERVFGSFLAHPAVVLGIAALCAAMGLSILGAFTLQLPSSLTTRLAGVGGPGPTGAFGMGLVSGLIAAPCTGPVLAVILAVIATSGSLAVGAILMASFSLGLGGPFLGLALVSGQLQRLPRSGPWMGLVKGILAVAMFTVALYYVEIAFPGLGEVFAAIGTLPALGWALFGITLGVIGLRVDAGKSSMVFKGASVVAMTMGVSGWLFSEPPSVRASEDSGASIAWVRDHAEGFEQAKREGKPAIIDFTAEWCVACKELDKHVFSHPDVLSEAERFVAMKLDATELDEATEALFKRYSVMGLPTVLFFDSDGELLDNPRVTGMLPAEKFREFMGRVE